MPPQHKGGLWESQEHAGTLLHDQIPGERQGETLQPKGMLGLQTGRVEKTLKANIGHLLHQGSATPCGISLSWAFSLRHRKGIPCAHPKLR